MKTLLAVEGKLTPCCSKTNITYSFALPYDTERLDIFFSYSPKILDDLEKARELIAECIELGGDKYKETDLNKWKSILHLKNLLTVSIDDSKGFRGSAHRHNPMQHHFITAEAATEGFISGPVEKGLWRVTISVHAVITESCSYKLEVCEGSNDD